MSKRKFLSFIICFVLIIFSSVLFSACKESVNNQITIEKVTISDFRIVEEEILDEIKIDLKVFLPVCDCINGEIICDFYIKENKNWDNLIYAGGGRSGFNYVYSYNHRHCYFSILFYNPKPSSTYYNECFKLEKGNTLVFNIKCAEGSSLINIEEQILFNY